MRSRAVARSGPWTISLATSESKAVVTSLPVPMPESTLTPSPDGSR